MDGDTPQRGSRGRPDRRGVAGRRGFAGSVVDAARGILVAGAGRNLRLQLGAAVAAVALTLALAGGLGRGPGLDGVRVAVVLGWVPIVLGAEIVNTAIERLADLVDDEHGLGVDPRLRDIKDLAAGAVLTISLGSVLTAVIVLGPPLVTTLSTL
jgi:undecaprenol kinase/diacylglycerol kinase (ATP)